MCEAIVPHSARAQVFRLTPSLGISQVYDSNLFFSTSNRQADSIWRVSPAIESEYRATPWTLIGRFTLDAERFSEHPELSSLQARYHAMTDLRYRPTARVTVGAVTEFSKTQTPGELNAETAVTLARADARRLAFHPSATYRFDPVTEGTLDYVYTEDRLAGTRLRAQTFNVGAARHLSLRDTASVGYGVRQLQFGPDDTSTSHVLSAGWSHSLTPLASLTLHGGPRVSDRGPAPELSAAFRYHLRRADLTVTYLRGQTTLIGLADSVDTHGLAATASYTPRPSLRMRITPGIYRTVSRGTEARVYRLAFAATRPMGRWLSLDAAYDLNVQHGDIYTARPQDRIARHVAMIRLGAAPPVRKN
jgi:hypothetical protein